MMKKHILILITVSGVLLPCRSQTDSSAVIYAWKLEDDFTRLVPEDIDTNLPDFQRYYLNYENSISNAYLGNLGSPTISNVYTSRIYNDDVFFLNSYLPYFHTSENTIYYNTRKPFTRLSYYIGPGLHVTNIMYAEKEESFEAFHTQNITPKLNFGMRYFTISSRGQYKYTQVKNFNIFRFNTSYSGQRYTAYGTVNINHCRNNENGGIIDSLFHMGDTTYRTSIPTYFGGGPAPKYESNAQNQVWYYDIMLSQRLKLFTIASRIDTTELTRGRNMAEPLLSYVFRAQRSAKAYMDADPVDPGFYENVYFNSSETLDSLADFRLTNMLKLEFKTTFRRKVQLSMYGLIGHEYDKYYFYSLWDTLHNPYDTIVTAADTLVRPWIGESGDTLKGISKTSPLSSTFFAYGAFGNFWNRVKLTFNGKIYFAGEKSGETELSGLLNTRINLFKKEFLFDAAVVFENKKPSYLLQNYYSNHYIWNEYQRVMESEKITNLSGKISTPSNKFELAGNYYLISDLFYFNQEAIPENYGNTINILTVELGKTFRLWELASENRIVYQASENQSVLPLPNFVFFNSTYLNHTFHFKSTGGELQTIVGFDIYYTTDYYGYMYSPALAQFYVQEDQYIGNYPLMDAYLNIKLKRTRFFMKLQHFNSNWSSKEYYSAIHYPYSAMALKFGLSWIFYD